MQATILPMLDYGDILYGHASNSTLRPLDAIYHNVLRFITGDGFRTHHCTLYDSVGWYSLNYRRKQHSILFIYKALIAKLPLYLTRLLSIKNLSHYTRSQDWITLEAPKTRTNLGNTAFSTYAPYIWNKCQDTLKLDCFVSIESFKNVLLNMIMEEAKCTCFE